MSDTGRFRKAATAGAELRGAPHAPALLPRLARSAANAEHQLLGAMFVADWDAIDAAIAIASRATLWGELETEAFKIVTQWAKERKPLDPTLLAPLLVSASGYDVETVVGSLMEWMDAAWNAHHIASYAEAVVSAYQQREAVFAVNEFGRVIQDGGDIEAEHPKLAQRLAEIAAASATADVSASHIGALYAHAVAASANGMQAGIPSGLHPLDQAIQGGAKPSQLIVVAARPSHGKSVLGCQWALRAAQSGKHAMLLSYEMEPSEVAGRWLRMADVRADDELCVEMFRELPLYCIDAAAWDIGRIEAECRAARRSERPDLLIVDYLTLIPSHDKRMDQIRFLEDLTRRLKQLARTLKIPVIVLAQLNREIDSRDDKTPRLRDLRGCGSIEQDADIVIGLWRDEPSRLHVIKQRNGGATSLMSITVHPTKGTFTEAADDREVPTWS